MIVYDQSSCSYVYHLIYPWALTCSIFKAKYDSISMITQILEFLCPDAQEFFSIIVYQDLKFNSDRYKLMSIMMNLTEKCKE